jgi:hypothetical protein
MLVRFPPSNHALMVDVGGAASSACSPMKLDCTRTENVHNACFNRFLQRRHSRNTVATATDVSFLYDQRATFATPASELPIHRQHTLHVRNHHHDNQHAPPAAQVMDHHRQSTTMHHLWPRTPPPLSACIVIVHPLDMPKLTLALTR